MNNMKWNRQDTLMVLIGLIPALVGLWMYKELPVQMAIHFNAHNEVNGTMGRPAALAILVFLAGIPLYSKLGRIMDPKKENYGKFEGAYGKFRWVITIFVFLVGMFLITYNLGYDVSPEWISSVLIGILFMIIGNFMGQIRFNYTFGIRTPWTLSNETVWRKTHRMAGPLWMLAGIMMALSAFTSGAWGAIPMISSIAVAVLIPTGYSYWLHRGLKT
jgi:uncharacterized membrane protein